MTALTMSLKHFCRSIELNDSYLRGYYGLKLVTSKLVPLLTEMSSSGKRNTHQDDDEIPIPNVSTVKKLEEISTNKLGEIIRNFGSGKKSWSGYDKAEIIAAQELLDRDGKTVR